MSGVGRRIGRAPYAPLVVAAVLAQHAAVAMLYRGLGKPLTADAEFWLLPLRAAAKVADGPAALAAILTLAILSSGVTAMLSLWRARDAGGAHMPAAALALVPGVQIPAIGLLAILPSASKDVTVPQVGGPARVGDMIAGVAIGMGLCVFAVSVSALVFGEYGMGLFVLAPVLMGLVTGYTANRRSLLSSGDTSKLVMITAGLGGLMLILFALEGAICLIMAAPLALVCVVIGGELGRSLAIQRGRRARPTAMSVAVLPLVFALDAAIPAQLQIASVESVDIAASPTQVWRTLTADGDIGPAPPLPFRLGLAYPVASELRGEGVGAERIGRFSTGEARERVTAWEPGRRLAFTVLSTPPVIRELSPWPTVHAPHAVGYFNTEWTRFDLAPQPDGRTRLTIRASHTLRLDPAPYWAPMARVAITANNRRALAHMKREAEAAAMTVAVAPPLR